MVLCRSRSWEQLILADFSGAIFDTLWAWLERVWSGNFGQFLWILIKVRHYGDAKAKQKRTFSHFVQTMSRVNGVQGDDRWLSTWISASINGGITYDDSCPPMQNGKPIVASKNNHESMVILFVLDLPCSNPDCWVALALIAQSSRLIKASYCWTFLACVPYPYVTGFRQLWSSVRALMLLTWHFSWDNFLIYRCGLYKKNENPKTICLTCRPGASQPSPGAWMRYT